MCLKEISVHSKENINVCQFLGYQHSPSTSSIDNFKLASCRVAMTESTNKIVGKVSMNKQREKHTNLEYPITSSMINVQNITSRYTSGN